MPRILVVEPDAAAAGRIEHALRQRDWDVVCVRGIEAAMQTTSEQETHAVVIGPGVDSPREVVGTVSHGRAGGVPITVLSEMTPGALGLTEMPRLRILSADASPADVAGAVQRGLDAAPAAGPEMNAGRELTSQELFGDMIAEMDTPEAAAAQEVATPAVPEPPPPPPRRPEAEKPVAEPVGAASDSEPAARSRRPAEAATKVPAKKAKKRSAGGEADVNRVLEETLSGTGVRLKPRRRPPEKKPHRPKPVGDVDALLGGALKGLGGESGSRAARKSDTQMPQAFEELERKVSRTGVRPPAETAEAGKPSKSRPIAEPVEAKPAGKRGKAAKAEKKKKSRPIAAKEKPAESEAIEFGAYQLVERVALGGMAEVWRARMRGVEGFAKMVAIKKILPHLTDNEEFSEMFVDEAKLAAQLTHNNIIHIYDFGKIGDEYFIAMEYVEGKDLRAILSAARRSGEALPLGLALLIGSRLASALGYAHRKKDFEDQDLGLVHRDVSPQNVLISYEGDIKLCDFGIAKAVSKVSKTQIGALKGKVQYMSPEQAWGETVDARSDIFSLGVLLFEMLTGERLFAGSSELSILESVREGKVRGPKELNPEIPDGVNEVVLRALAKDPRDRYQTAGEMQDALEACLQEVHPTPTVSDLARYLKALFGGEAEAKSRQEGTREPSGRGAVAGAEVEMAQPLAASAAEEGAVPRWALYGGIAAVVLVGIITIVWLSGHSSRKTAEAAPPTTQAISPQSTTGEESQGASAPTTSEVAPSAAAVQTQTAEEPAASAGKSTKSATEPSATKTGKSETEAAASDQAKEKPEAKQAASPKTAASQSDTLKQLDAMVAEEVSKREEALRKKMEEEQDRLKKQIEEANKVAAGAQPAATDQTESSTPTPESGSEASSQPAAGAAKNGNATKPETTKSTKSPPAAKSEKSAQAPSEPTPPELVSLPNPDFPASAANEPAGTKIVVWALVDETGAVTQTRLESGVDTDAGINRAAIAAVRAAQFKPATKDGAKVKMWYKLTVPVR